MSTDLYNIVMNAGDFLKGHLTNQPEVGIVLGSGLGALVGRLDSDFSISTADIPGFPTSTVVGHKGKLIFGKLGGKHVVLSAGRVHYYEGYPLHQVTLAIRVMAYLSCKTVILTNAVGGISDILKPGDLVAISDHINMMGNNPLIGIHDDRLGPRFPDMTDIYSPDLISLAHSIAKELNISLKSGILVATSGPSYETPAEIKMMHCAGADVVGMSVVPEAIVARQSGLNILTISCVTNFAAGRSSSPLHHEEVLEESEKISEDFQTLIETIVDRL